MLEVLVRGVCLGGGIATIVAEGITSFVVVLDALLVLFESVGGIEGFTVLLVVSVVIAPTCNFCCSAFITSFSRIVTGGGFVALLVSVTRSFRLGDDTTTLPPRPNMLSILEYSITLAWATLRISIASANSNTFIKISPSID